MASQLLGSSNPGGVGICESHGAQAGGSAYDRSGQEKSSRWLQTWPTQPPLPPCCQLCPSITASAITFCLLKLRAAFSCRYGNFSQRRYVVFKGRLTPSYYVCSCSVSYCTSLLLVAMWLAFLTLVLFQEFSKSFLYHVK